MDKFNFHGDLTFFTNQDHDNLKDRFVRILNSDTQFFDVLVGYFRSSGFNELYESIKKVEKTRILVGINVDEATYNYVNTSNDLIDNIFSSNAAIDNFNEHLAQEINSAEDTPEVVSSINSFIELLMSGRLELRVYPHSTIHAKLYIMRKDQKKVFDSFGTVITGSSNFSKAGLVDNLEFNVELKDSRDVQFALEKFEDLWEQGVPITESYVDTINNKTWLNEQKYPPQYLYYKLLSDYFETELSDEIKSYHIPSNFKVLMYQDDAVKRAKEIIEAYNGVFISDVVGLGKTYICAMLAQILSPGKKLILCPPVLVEYWRDVFLEFNVSATVESIGKIDALLDSNYHQYEYIFVDEAHRFRNQNTESYQKLHQLCFQKKVILITATPLNNKIEDLANLIYIFQPKNNSNIIPDTKNIEKYFNTLIKMKKNYIKTEDNEGIKNLSKKIQDEVLRNIMIRRTRGEIEEFYKDDLKTQGLNFPTLEAPIKTTYLLDNNLDSIFNQTIELIKNLKYARYKPFLYLDKQEKLNINKLVTGQHNLAGFMKSLLVKRLESSFYAFKQTINRFIKSHIYAINMLKDNAFYIGDKINIYDLLSNNQEEKIEELLKDEKLSLYKASDFNKDFETDLLHDFEILKKINCLWKDIKNDPKFDTLKTTLKLKLKDPHDKVIIFSESAETVDYLKENLVAQGFKVIAFTGNDKAPLKREIERNFDPNIDDHLQRNDYNVLITSDVLSEGINLHKANHIINYDLPWNPTKIMQRVGRINRVGTNHKKILINNFFPTDQSHNHLTLEENIMNKIQVFHDILGEDHKYLTEEEAVSSHGIFSKNILEEIDGLTKKEAVEESELKHLQVIRKIKEHDPKLYERILDMPYKVRCCVDGEKKDLITYLRKGSLKKFFKSDEVEVKEMPFKEAVKIYEESVDKRVYKVTNNFHKLLKSNEEAFKEALKENQRILEQGKIRNQNDLKVIRILKTLARIRPEERPLILKYIRLWNDGVMPKVLTNKILGIMTKEKNSDVILRKIQHLIPKVYLEYRNETSLEKFEKSEIVLSLNRRGI